MAQKLCPFAFAWSESIPEGILSQDPCCSLGNVCWLGSSSSHFQSWALPRSSLTRPVTPEEGALPHVMCSENLWIWHFRTWFSRHGGDGLTIGLDDLGGLFPTLMILCFYDSFHLSHDFGCWEVAVTAFPWRVQELEEEVQLHPIPSASQFERPWPSLVSVVWKLHCMTQKSTVIYTSTVASLAITFHCSFSLNL